MNKIQYSQTQRKIVETTEGPMAVIASAGSGKTRVLTGRIAHILETVPGSYRILAFTFTNKAADEMKERLSSISNVEDRVFIGTIHSFCLNILREKGYVIGYQAMPHIFEKESDRLEVITEVFERNELLSNLFSRKNEKQQKQLLYDTLNHIGNRKKNLKFDSVENEEELAILYDDYNRILAEQNAIDYDDIILLAYRIFSERPKISELYRKLYKYICVDEAQDLNFAQYHFIKALCGTEQKNVLMVGDDKQAIFGFNGSDKKYFSSSFIEEFKAKEIHLTENYRSSKSVIRVSNHIYPNSIDESKAVYEGGVYFYAANDENDEADYVIRMINHYRNNLEPENKKQIEGEVSYDNICIIARNKYIFKTIEDQLCSKKIPYYYKRGSDTILFESDELRIYELGVRAILNPMDKLHLRQILTLIKINNIDTNNLTLTLCKEKLAQLQNPIFNGVIAGWERIEKNNSNFRGSLDQIQTFLKDVSEEGEENLLELLYNEVDHAKKLWKKFCSSVPPDKISIQGFIQNIALGMVNVTNIKDTGVTLSTIHSIKGLEYDIVFVIGLNEGSFPDYRAVRARGKQLDEEKNLTYVALTRAKRFLHLSYPKTKFMPWDKETPYKQNASRYLKDVFDNEKI